MAREMTLIDPISGRSVTASPRPVRRVIGTVGRRRLANFLIAPEQVDFLALPAFLEAELICGQVLLSLCIIDMDHAAPDWAPQAFSPACRGAALRLAVRDRRDGSSAVWVGNRFCNSFLSPFFPLFGLHGFESGLHGEENPESFFLSSSDWHLDSRLGQNRIDIDDSDFDRLIAAGIASYGPGREAGRFSRVELHKDCPSRFHKVAATETHLRLPHASFSGDLRLSPGGRYEWLFCGEVDGEGRALKT
jgi:hypothetical protein